MLEEAGLAASWRDLATQTRDPAVAEALIQCADELDHLVRGEWGHPAGQVAVAFILTLTGDVVEIVQSPINPGHYGVVQFSVVPELMTLPDGTQRRMPKGLTAPVMTWAAAFARAALLTSDRQDHGDGTSAATPAVDQPGA